MTVYNGVRFHYLSYDNIKKLNNIKLKLIRGLIRDANIHGKTVKENDLWIYYRRIRKGRMTLPQIYKEGRK